MNNNEELKDYIKDIISNEISITKKDIIMETIDEIESSDVLIVLADIISNKVLNRSIEDIAYYLDLVLYKNYKNDIELMKILITISNIPIELLHIYNEGLLRLEEQARFGINTAIDYMMDEKLKETVGLTTLAKKFKRYNTLLKTQRYTYEDVEESVSSTLYKLLIEFKDEHNDSKTHTIHMIEKDGLYNGTFYEYPLYAKENDFGELEINITLHDSIVTLIFDQKANTITEYVNGIKTQSKADGWMVKVYNDKLKAEQVKANNRAIHNSNPNVLLKTL